MLCSRSLGHGYCVWDIGGPLILPKVSGVPCYSLLGILSAAPECQPETQNAIAVPSIYTQVAHYVPWIQRNVLIPNPKIDLYMEGGTNAALNEFPFLVKVTYGRVSKCAGAILSEYFVITTALCVKEKKFGLLSVIAGSNNGFQKRAVGPLRQHEDFDAITMANDICILQLKHPFVFNNFVSKIPLLNEFEYNGTFRAATVRQLFADTTISGWALSTPQKLIMAEVPFGACFKTYGCSIESLNHKAVCAARLDANFKTCHLVRGSPMTGDLFNGSKILLGLASFGTNCTTSGNPSVFIKLEDYYPWIQENDLIKGDNNAPLFALPFQAAIFFQRRFVCGGAVLNRNYIVSSASCFIKRAVASQFTISVGKNVLGTIEEFEQNRTVEAIHIHEDFVDLENWRTNDIALLYFSTPIIINKAVQPALIPLAQYRPNGFAIASGWILGIFKNKILQNGTIPILQDNDCINAFNNTRFITDTMFCASALASVICLNDPGGPLTQMFDSNCHMLVGIASPDCGIIGTPTVYTRVGSFSGWIQKKVDITKERNLRQNSTLSPQGTTDANRNEFPFVVRILDLSRNTICVGTLMNSFMVITSAFCVVDRLPKNIKVIAGDHYVRAIDSTEKERGMNAMKIHQDFDKLTQANDIAILFLNGNFKMGTSISTIKISASTLNIFDLDLILVGWGRLPSSMTLEDRALQKVQVDAMQQGSCLAAYGCSMPNYPPSVLCIQIPGNSTAGFGGGYLGAPVVQKRFNGSFVLHGMASYRHPCNQTICPAVFTSFPYYQQWLYDVFAGGTLASPKELPFHVIIAVEGKPVCGGALVSEWYVITAAYCFLTPKRVDVEKILVVMGTRLGVYPYDIQASVRKVREYNFPREYWERDRDYNIALVELESPVTFTSSIKPAFIPLDNGFYEHPENVTISGYTFNYTFTNVLRKTEAPTIILRECRRLYNVSFTPIYSKSVCTSPNIPVMCFCDHGSPMTDISPSPPKCHRLIGVASFCRDCEGRRYPSIYTHVPEHIMWMQSITDQSHPLNNTCVH